MKFNYPHENFNVYPGKNKYTIVDQRHPTIHTIRIDNKLNSRSIYYKNKLCKTMHQ